MGFWANWHWRRETKARERARRRWLVLRREEFESEEEFEKYQNDSKLRLVIQGENICPVVNFEEKTVNDWCTSFFKVNKVTKNEI